MEISNDLKVMNVFINNTDKQSVSGETVWLSVQTDHRFINTMEWVNFLIQKNETKYIGMSLTYPNLM